VGYYSFFALQGAAIMGTEITLDVAGVSVTYGKNEIGIDHGSLFQEGDRQAIRSDQLNYDWYAEAGADPRPAEMAFKRSLGEVVPRLELLGFSLKCVRQEYDLIARRWIDENQSFQEDDGRTPNVMSFDEFLQFAASFPLESLDDTIISGTDEAIRGRLRTRFKERQLKRIAGYRPYCSNASSERGWFVELIGILRPYSVLRLLGEIQANQAASVVWQYGPLVEAGWADELHFVPSARRNETFLLATEGSSDVHILRHAIAILRPGIMDFFRFIDVSERHPFSGTGSLVKFAEGLAKIDVHNQVLFIFDNDAEGRSAHECLCRLTLPGNMTGIMLPELAQFREFAARGPDGLYKADINGRAAAIECYLDLKVANFPEATVRWLNYKRELDTYQGALEHKGSYAELFLQQTADTLAAGVYDFSKIEAVLDIIESKCSEIAARRFCSAL
jgi:hypothetical protein